MRVTDSRTGGSKYCVYRAPRRCVSTHVTARVSRASLRRSAIPAVLDVAVLDMNHGWPNVGITTGSSRRSRTPRASRRPPLLPRRACRSAPISVRTSAARCKLPDPEDDRFAIYVGTGGPGHLDPRLERRQRPRSAGRRSRIPSWEAPAVPPVRRDRRRDDAALSRSATRSGLDVPVAATSPSQWRGAGERREERGPSTTS